MGRGQCGEQGSRKERTILIKAMSGIRSNMNTNLHQKNPFYVTFAVLRHSVFLPVIPFLSDHQQFLCAGDTL